MHIQNELYIGFIIYAAVAFVGLLLYAYRVTIGHDLKQLQKPLSIVSINHSQIIVNFWCISHFVMYFVLGVLSPSYWWLWMLLGVLWEWFEIVCERNQVMYIDGKWSDIPVNLSGLLMGVFVHDRILTPIYKDN